MDARNIVVELEVPSEAEIAAFDAITQRIPGTPDLSLGGVLYAFYNPYTTAVVSVVSGNGLALGVGTAKLNPIDGPARTVKGEAYAFNRAVKNLIHEFFVADVPKKRKRKKKKKHPTW